jgi:hypothetical protein
MWSRLKSYSLAACLFVFLFVVVGASLHLKLTGAFLAALSGMCLIIHALHRWGEARPGAATRTETRSGRVGARFIAGEAQNQAGGSEQLAPWVASGTKQ